MFSTALCRLAASVSQTAARTSRPIRNASAALAVPRVGLHAHDLPSAIRGALRGSWALNDGISDEHGGLSPWFGAALAAAGAATVASSPSECAPKRPMQSMLKDPFYIETLEDANTHVPESENRLKSYNTRRCPNFLPIDCTSRALS